ncbi:hypothetical protein D9619_003212 [Psilocybe cf. subviscida]|uniref:Aspartate aminotransferase n=1 Tax=Psilocybe cf. subviscida TaxID=2480587 RepID=A0A8H5AX56_9AGAR|nr:hypothetical protein D9619_003212 [Psilocybe cf. subviscida]
MRVLCVPLFLDMLSATFARRSALSGARSVSTWSSVVAGPPDAILGITEAFKADKDPRKINLGVGAYRDENGKPYVLPSVKKAEELVRTANPDKEYLPITGLAEFTKNAALLAYGADSAPLKAGAISVTQSISGTGALRIGGAFLARHYPGAKAIYLPTPTWGNHIPIFRDSGLEVRGYRYFDKSTVGLDFEGLKADLKAAPEGSVVLLHACAHNPTGIDPTQEQWAAISDICNEKKLFPFFDMAYQGFASGSTVQDAFAVRHFVEQGHQIALCQSFAKNMGLYGERVGAFSLTTADAEEKARVDSQLKIIIRPMYSNPPVHGARIANAILSNSELYSQWESEVKGMAERIISMREKLYNTLTHDLKTPGEWGHIKSQIGMFSFTGLTQPQTKALAEKAHVYMTADGRISMAGLNGNNVEYFAESVNKATYSISMACMSSPSMTPALPGAWASNKTLSRIYHATSDNTPKLPSRDLDGIRNENPHPALLQKHTLSGSATCALGMNVEPTGGIVDGIVDREASDVDDDLNDAEDFYSFISHSSQEDTDTTLFPDKLSITRVDLSDGTGLREPRVADSRPLSGEKFAFDIKMLQLGSRMRQHASAFASTLTQEFDGGDDGPQTDPGEDGDASTTTSAVSDSYVMHGDKSRKRASPCHSGASMNQHCSATSNDGDDVHGEEDSNLDNCSERSGHTADAPQAGQSINDRSDAGQSPRDTTSSYSQSFWHCEQRRNGVANRPGALHGMSLLHLAQPSGDSPWTLSLDPTQPSNNLNPLSRQPSGTTRSSVSLSDESSIAFNSSQMHAMISEDHIPSPSYRQSPAARIRARYYNDGYEIRTMPRHQQESSEYSSSYSSPQAYSFPTMNTMSSSSRSPPTPPFIIYAHNDPPRTKATGVIQKTKALCSKFKKFVTRSKNSIPPPPAVEYDPFLRRNAMDLVEHDVSSPLPDLGGRPSVSSNGHQGFHRSTKVSTVSVPLAHRVGHRRTDAVDVHRVYETSTPDGEREKNTKASRRFSLPVFAGSTSSSSRRFSTFPSNRRPKLSMISAAHLG